MRSTSNVARTAHTALLLAATVAAAACGPTAGSASLEAVPSAARTGTGRPSDRIGVAELQTAPGMTALDLIRMRRPEYLRAYASPRLSMGGVPATVVYVDGSPWGSLDALGSIPANLVAEIRRVPVGEARMRYGPGIQGAVIDVRLLRRR